MTVRTLTIVALSVALLGAAAHCGPDAEDRPRLESGECLPAPGVRCGFVRGPGAIGGSGAGSTGAPIAAGGNGADAALPGDTTGGGQTSFGDGGLFGDAGSGGSSDTLDPFDPFNPFGTGASDLFPPGLAFDGG